MDSQQNNTPEPGSPEKTLLQAEMLANRLEKNLKHLRKWARNADVECFRIYDRDIPELPFALDLYGSRAHLQAYSKPLLDARAQHRWLSAMHEAAARAIGLAPGDVVLKQRQGQRPEAQYRKLASAGRDFVVTEAGHRFLVNLTDHLDTGLFLDHRQTRALVGKLARDKHVLNLFCYTGSFSVYAARGGAGSTTSVDLSRTYLDWARRNFELNGIEGERNRLVQADALRFIENERASRDRYDIVVLDPPSFSNSKRMQGVLDVQRDHAMLIRGCLALLNPGGKLLFSTNLRSFRLDSAAVADVATQEISERTVPPDFRNRKIHRCWWIARGN
ncbi:MAG TPA: class I SAM-dependent methyltransferase [Burkholderiales bacterium]|nr:class I SAM-dependent methyltransferase [Burkholderiales bacterium]